MENNKTVFCAKFGGFGIVQKENNDYFKIWFFDKSITRYIEKRKHNFIYDNKINCLIFDF
jgi:hypothetical protein